MEEIYLRVCRVHPDPTLLGIQRPDYAVLHGLFHPRRRQRPVALGQRELYRHALDLWKKRRRRLGLFGPSEELVDPGNVVVEFALLCDAAAAGLRGLGR